MRSTAARFKFSSSPTVVMCLRHTLDAGLSATSLLVLAHDTGARRLYDKLGYVESARDRIEQHGWSPSPQEVILLRKSI